MVLGRTGQATVHKAVLRWVLAIGMLHVEVVVEESGDGQRQFAHVKTRTAQDHTADITEIIIGINLKPLILLGGILWMLVILGCKLRLFFLDTKAQLAVEVAGINKRIATTQVRSLPLIGNVLALRVNGILVSTCL